jgi:hypothetical protein
VFHEDARQVGSNARRDPLRDLGGSAVVILTNCLSVLIRADDLLDLSHGSPPLNEFDPIAEGITKLEPAVAGKRNALDDFNSKCGDLEFPLFKVADFISDVGFGGIAIHPILDSDVDFAISGLEPQAATPCQARRFLDFREAENAAIEAPGLLFGTIWDGQLDVVNASDHFIAPLQRMRNMPSARLRCAV